MEEIQQENENINTHRKKLKKQQDQYDAAQMCIHSMTNAFPELKVLVA